MKLRTVLGLMAVGGAAYAHKQRGGTLTLESLKESGRALADSVVGQAMKLLGPTTGASQAGTSDTSGRTSTYADISRRFDDDKLH